MYQSFNCAKRRFYSTNSIDIRLDLGVYLVPSGPSPLRVTSPPCGLGKKVESNGKKPRINGILEGVHTPILLSRDTLAFSRQLITRLKVFDKNYHTTIGFTSSLNSKSILEPG